MCFSEHQGGSLSFHPLAPGQLRHGCYLPGTYRSVPSVMTLHTATEALRCRGSLWRRFCLPPALETFGNVWRLLWWSQLEGGDASDIWRVEARVAGKPPRVHGIAAPPSPPPTRTVQTVRPQTAVILRSRDPASLLFLIRGLQCFLDG